MSSFRDSTRPAPGRVGRYELLRRLAVGGMGEIFLARERGVAGVDRLVVVKLMLEDLADAAENVALFIDEARIAVQLAHPNIVQVYEFGEADGAYFMAMEYVPGQNLARVCERAVRRRVPYPRVTAAHVVAEMVRGLDFAHNARDSRGKPMEIVHRDISPHNVLISIGGDVKLLDFGIAHASVRRQRTRTGVLRGKFAYMSPEQLDQSSLDARSDVFCAGIVLWETTLLRRLFAGETEMDTVRLLSACKVPAPRSIEPDYPEDLEAVVMTALAADPTERFQSAGAMAAALRNVLKRRPPVDKEALGAMVSVLFPDTLPNDLAEVVRITAPVQAAVPEPEVESKVIHEDTAPNPLPPLASNESPEAPNSLPPLAGGGPGWGAKTKWLLIATTTLLAATVAFFALRGTATEPSAAAPAADAGPADAGPSDATTAVATATVVDASALPVTPNAADARPRRAIRRRPTRPVRVSPAAVDAGLRKLVVRRQPVDAAPPKPPAKGRLAVAAQPYGRVTINGKPYGTTDLVELLPPGTYRIRVKMSDGSGVRSGSAVVESNKKTKCRVAGSSLRCGSPR